MITGVMTMLQRWWVHTKALINETHALMFDSHDMMSKSGFTLIVKAADVEAMERRVKWLEEGRAWAIAEHACDCDAFDNQPCTCGLAAWLAAEPKEDV